MTPNQIRDRLKISPDRLDAINAILLDPDMRVVNDFLEVVAQYGAPEEINQKAAAARHLPNLLQKVESHTPQYLEDLRWLMAQRDAGVFISEADYRRKVLGDKANSITFADDFAVDTGSECGAVFPLAANGRSARHR